jgi:hypothetical protein
MAVSKRTRYEVFRRDGNTCRYCGAHAPEVKITIDHVVPESLGGSDDPSNLVTACMPCNSGKSSSAPDEHLVAQVDERALRWAKAMVIAGHHLAGRRADRDVIRQAFTDAWNAWTYSDGAGGRVQFELPVDWPLSIDSLRTAGLDLDDITDAVDQTMRRRNVSDPFRYFCGVAWTMVRAKQDSALYYAERDEHIPIQEL